jgi:chromosome segregation ATPase
MTSRFILGWLLLYGLFLGAADLFSEEIYRWTDDKGTTHFTDDPSKVPEKYRREAEGINLPQERVEEDGRIRGSDEKNRGSGERRDRVKDYLDETDKKIEAKKSIEKKISKLEEEMRLSEERLKWIEDYEKENYQYYMPYRDRKTGNVVPVASPYYAEKVRLEKRIESIKSEIKALQEEVSTILKSL